MLKTLGCYDSLIDASAYTMGQNVQQLYTIWYVHLLCSARARLLPQCDNTDSALLAILSAGSN